MKEWPVILFIAILVATAVSCKKSETSGNTCVCKNAQGAVVSSQTFSDTDASEKCTALNNYSQSCRLE